jgi:hypothetical protein
MPLLTLDKFVDKYGEALEKALEFQEFDKGLELAEKLFLLENMDQQTRIACGTITTLMLGSQLKAVLLKAKQIQASMALSGPEEEAVKTNLEIIAKEGKVN